MTVKEFFEELKELKPALDLLKEVYVCYCDEIITAVGGIPVSKAGKEVDLSDFIASAEAIHKSRKLAIDTDNDTVNPESVTLEVVPVGDGALFGRVQLF